MKELKMNKGSSINRMVKDIHCAVLEKGGLKDQLAEVKQDVNFIKNEVRLDGENSPKGFEAIFRFLQGQIEELRVMHRHQRRWRDVKKSLKAYWNSGPVIKTIWKIVSHRRMMMLYIVILLFALGLLDRKAVVEIIHKILPFL